MGCKVQTVGQVGGSCCDMLEYHVSEHDCPFLREVYGWLLQLCCAWCGFDECVAKDFAIVLAEGLAACIYAMRVFCVSRAAGSALLLPLSHS